MNQITFNASIQVKFIEPIEFFTEIHYSLIGEDYKIQLPESYHQIITADGNNSLVMTVLSSSLLFFRPLVYVESIRILRKASQEHSIIKYTNHIPYVLDIKDGTLVIPGEVVHWVDLFGRIQLSGLKHFFEIKNPDFKTTDEQAETDNLIKNILIRDL